MRFRLPRIFRWLIRMTEKIPAKTRTPVVVVLGATGTGKSKLAVDLALKFNGEVISADSMQVYKGLDILTNKVTPQEMQGVPHHMISAVDHWDKFDVTMFRKMALPIVESLLDQNKIPFIVGGTNYYIESLIWNILIDNPSSSGRTYSTAPKRFKLADADSTMDWDPKCEQIFDLFSSNRDTKELDHSLLLPWSNEELYRTLRLVDENRAKKLHPNDRRKVIRSLQIFFQTGRTHSALIADQVTSARSKSDGEGFTGETPSQVGGPMRYDNVICLWIQAPNDILEERIAQRVDKMIAQGLRDELEGFMDVLGSDKALLFTEGLLQSIGFKEFEDYVLLPPQDRRTERGDKIFDEGAQRLKLVTRQYARKQLKWIRQRFLRPSRRQVPPVYRLDGSSTDPFDWEHNVTAVASALLSAHLTAEEKNDPLLSEYRVPPEQVPEDDMIARKCETCDRTLLGVRQWEEHMRSYKHRKVIQKKKLSETNNEIGLNLVGRTKIDGNGNLKNSSANNG